jgi:hypothetical protein
VVWVALMLAQTPPPLVPFDGALTLNGACRQGSAEACSSVADVEIDVARDALASACAEGSVPACEAGRAVMPAREWKSGSEAPDELPANLDRARKSLVRACEVGRAVACEAAAGLMVVAGRRHFASELRMHAVALKKGGPVPPPAWLNPGSTAISAGESAVEVKQLKDPDLEAEGGWPGKVRRPAAMLRCPARDVVEVDKTDEGVVLLGCGRRIVCFQVASNASYVECGPPY